VYHQFDGWEIEVPVTIDGKLLPVAMSRSNAACWRMLDMFHGRAERLLVPVLDAAEPPSSRRKAASCA
jgi:hypothetical protein